MSSTSACWSRMWRTRSRAESWRSPSPSRWMGYLSSRLILSSIPDSGGASCSTSSIGWATTSLKDLGNLPKTLPTPAWLSPSIIFVTLPIHIRPSPAGASVSARYHLDNCFIPRSPSADRSVLILFFFHSRFFRIVRRKCSVAPNGYLY